VSYRPIPDALYQVVAHDARSECGYCRAPQVALPYRLEIEHLWPTSLGGGEDRANLWLSCHKCNKLKSNLVAAEDPLTHEEVPLFNPRHNNWSEHFVWRTGGVNIVGRTAIGRATVSALRLNDSFHQSARQVWILAGVYPPSSALMTKARFPTGVIPPEFTEQKHADEKNHTRRVDFTYDPPSPEPPIIARPRREVDKPGTLVFRTKATNSRGNTQLAERDKDREIYMSNHIILIEGHVR
jgi:5-methylcytosine-specific restriction endonuclease McrA